MQNINYIYLMCLILFQLYSNTDQQLIGCFSAASNITGILTDTNKVSACLHRYGALAVWDYATAGTLLYLMVVVMYFLWMGVILNYKIK